MNIRIDHVGMASPDPDRSVMFLETLLGLEPAAVTGPEQEMRLLTINQAGALLFSPAEDVPVQHVAFRVDEQTFGEVIKRLRDQGVPFGNDPEQPDNGQTSDDFGGHGRVYFLGPEGHFYEVVA